jgi:hypothetical protein
VLPVELGLHERSDVDIVDDDAADDSRHVDVGEHRVDDLDLA